MQDPHSLLPVAYRAAAQVVDSPVLAAEASERAVHQLTLAMLGGYPPHSPKSWLRVVARRSATALLRSDWARTRTMDLDAAEVVEVAAPPPRGPAPGSSWVRESLLPSLTPRQRDALGAAVTCNTTRAAARSCGMQPRDFRRSLDSISRRARRLLADAPLGLADLASPGSEPGCPA